MQIVEWLRVLMTSEYICSFLNNTPISKYLTNIQKEHSGFVSPSCEIQNSKHKWFLIHVLWNKLVLYFYIIFIYSENIFFFIYLSIVYMNIFFYQYYYYFKKHFKLVYSFTQPFKNISQCCLFDNEYHFYFYILLKCTYC